MALKRVGLGPTEREVKAYTGMAGKVLLQYLETLTNKEVNKMRERLFAWRMRAERSKVLKPICVEPEHFTLRTRTGYVYR